MTNEQMKKIFDTYCTKHKNRDSQFGFKTSPDVFAYLSEKPFWVATTEYKEPIVCDCCGMIKYHTMQPIIKQYYIVNEKFNGIYLMQQGMHQIVKKIENIHTNKKDAMKEAKQMSIECQKNNIAGYGSEKKRNLKL